MDADTDSSHNRSLCVYASRECLCLYIYIQTNNCVIVCLYASSHVCMHACMHVCMHVFMYACICVCTYVPTCVCVRMYISMYVCLCVCMRLHRNASQT